jgi:hypothetical protein
MMMKMNATVTALLMLGCSLGYAGLASAQTCTASGTFTGASYAGTTCGANAAFTKVCQNGDTLGSSALDAIQVNVGATNSNLNFTLTTPAFTPEIAVIASPCSANSACIVDAESPTTGTAGTPASIATGSLGTLTAGTYFVLVFDTNDGLCGTYNVTATGTLPVKLENFSVN